MKWQELAKKKELKVVGIMSGTSLDGVDFVLTKIKRVGRQIQFEYLDQAHIPFSNDLDFKIRKAVVNDCKVSEISDLHHELGQFYAAQLLKIKKKKKWKFDAVGLHGQTVFHRPPYSTLQIGEPTYLAYELDCPVVGDFRVADLAAGGEGAPIASLFHSVVLAPKFKNQSLCLQNLGGIGNVTFISKKAQVERSFDTGPANILMDQYIQKIDATKKFDLDGEMAAHGIPDQKLVSEILQHPFFSQKPPKSSGRELFGSDFLGKILKKMKSRSSEDIVASLLEVTVRSIADSYRRFLPQMPEVVVLCGGGAQNQQLIHRLKFHLPECKIISCEEIAWPSSAIEGAAFALLTAYRIWDLESNLPKTTGAKKSVRLGKVIEL